jgi:nucleoside-triphosphatase THEP1
VQLLIDSPDSLLASFASGNESGRLILVSGPSGSGKTHWCQALAERANLLGIHVDGLVSPAVFKGDLKVGIDLLNLESGVEKDLAVRRGEIGGGHNTLDWHFNDETLDWGNKILEELRDCQFLILDELGPLELVRGVGLTNGIAVITARQYRLACVVVRPALLDNAQILWPWGEFFCVPSSNPSEGSV